MKTTMSLLFFGWVFFAFSMDAREVLTKMQTMYETTSTFEYQTIYILFKGEKGTEEQEVYQGITFKDKKGMYQKINQQEFVYGADFSLVVDEENKSMTLQPAQEGRMFGMDLDQVLNNCSSTEVISKEGYYQVVLHIKTDSQLPVSLVTMRIDNKQYTLSQMDVYYTQFMDFSQTFQQTELELPHMQIQFKDFTQTPAMSPHQLELEYYITKKGQTVEPTDRFSQYSFYNNQAKK